MSNPQLQKLELLYWLAVIQDQNLINEVIWYGK